MFPNSGGSEYEQQTYKKSEDIFVFTIELLYTYKLPF